MLWRKLVALLSVFVYQSDLTHAALVERRIDDTQGDSATGLRPVYLPAEGVWNGLDCSQCQLKPDIARVFGGTYSEATYRPARGIVSVDIQFEGVAIDVYFILAPFSARLTTLTECLFILDGGEPATFRYQPGAEDTEFIYEHSVFSRTDLPDANHTLRITVPEVPHELFLNFDYAIYMHEDGTGTSSPSPTGSSTIPVLPGTSLSSSLTDRPLLTTVVVIPNADSVGPTAGVGNTSSTTTAVVAGSVAGSVAAIMLLAFFVGFFLWRRKRRQSKGNAQGSLMEEQYQSSSFGKHLFAHPRGQSYSTTDVADRGDTSTLGRDLYGQRSPSSGPGSVYSSPYGGIASSNHGIPQGAAVFSDADLERQDQISRRLQVMEQEMHALSRELEGGGAARPLSQGPEQGLSMAEMSEQMQAMQAQLVMLRQNQNDNPVGLASGPPPNYH